MTVEMINLNGVLHAFEVSGSLVEGENGCYDFEYSPLWESLEDVPDFEALLGLTSDDLF